MHGQEIALRGRVTDVAGRPLANATIVFTTSTGEAPVVTASADSGDFVARVRRQDGTVVMLVSLSGYQNAQRPVVLSGTGEALILQDVQLLRRVQSMKAVTTYGVQPRPYREGPGSQRLPGSNAVRLSRGDGTLGDVDGSLATSLALVPGVSITDGSVEGIAGASAFGLGSDQNVMTLNGATANGLTLPRDGLISTVRVATYDPKYGRTGGLEVSSELRSGTTIQYQVARVTLERPGLLAPAMSASSLSPRYSAIVSSATSGAFSGQRRFYNIAAQLSELAGNSRSLSALPAGTLSLLGTSPAAIASLLAAGAAVGLPMGVGTPEKTVSAASVVARVDLTPAAQEFASVNGSVLYLLTSAAFRRSTGVGLSPLGLSTRQAASDSYQGLLGVSWSPYFRSTLAETRATLATDADLSAPLLRLPAASVWMRPAAGISSPALLGLVGGSGSGPSQRRGTTGELSQEVSWMTRDRAHRFNAYADVTVQQHSATAEPGRFGNILFASIEDFRVGRASQFVRSPFSIAEDAHSLGGVIAFSDVYYATRESRAPAEIDGDAFLLQWGVRADLRAFGSRPDGAAQLTSSPWPRQDLPSTMQTISPMLGITWRRGQYEVPVGIATFTETRHTVTAGVRRYAGILPPATLAGVGRSFTSVDGTSVLDCTGSGMPSVDWRGWSTSPQLLPTACADDSSVASGVAPSATRFAPGFQTPHSWRSEASWSWLVSRAISTSLGAVYSDNARLIQSVDLNLRAEPSLRLADEQGRPVFTIPGQIDSRLGPLGTTGSRAYNQYGEVRELRSVRRSHAQYLVAGMTLRLGTGPTRAPTESPQRATGSVRLQYSRSSVREQRGGWEGSTGGDPRTLEWGRSDSERESLVAVLQGRVADLGSFMFAFRAVGGRAYTPMVGSDINGDGIANDRAFVWNVASLPAGPSQATMMSLISTASPAVRACLRHEANRIAAPSSCSTGWSVAMANATITIDPRYLPLSGRSALSIHVLNVMAGLDQVLHGSGSRRGWGQLTPPDPVLLFVRGFDASTGKYQYDVNPGFGSTERLRGLFELPFRVVVDYRLDWSRDPELQVIDDQLVQVRRAGLVEVPEIQERFLRMAEMGSADLRLLLRLGKDLSLDSAQVSTIARFDRELGQVRESLYADLATAFARNTGRPAGDELRRKWHATISASIRETYAVYRRADAVLSSEQRAFLKSRGLAPELRRDEQWLREATSGAQLRMR